MTMMMMVMVLSYSTLITCNNNDCILFNKATTTSIATTITPIDDNINSVDDAADEMTILN